MDETLKTVLTGSNITLFKEHLLKRAPAGYSEDNPFIDFIKLKSFVLDRSLTTKELSAKNALDNIVASYKSMLPFKEFLQEAIDTE